MTMMKIMMMMMMLMTVTMLMTMMMMISLFSISVTARVPTRQMDASLGSHIHSSVRRVADKEKQMKLPYGCTPWCHMATMVYVFIL